MLYERKSGQLMTASMMDYFMPRAAIMKTSSTFWTSQSPAKTIRSASKVSASSAPLAGHCQRRRRRPGARGHAAGAADLQMPLTPLNLWRALQVG